MPLYPMPLYPMPLYPLPKYPVPLYPNHNTIMLPTIKAVSFLRIVVSTIVCLAKIDNSTVSKAADPCRKDKDSSVSNAR